MCVSQWYSLQFCDVGVTLGNVYASHTYLWSSQGFIKYGMLNKQNASEIYKYVDLVYTTSVNIVS